jgi:hypothetical protein
LFFAFAVAKVLLFLKLPKFFLLFLQIFIKKGLPIDYLWQTDVF